MPGWDGPATVPVDFDGIGGADGTDLISGLNSSSRDVSFGRFRPTGAPPRSWSARCRTLKFGMSRRLVPSSTPLMGEVVWPSANHFSTAARSNVYPSPTQSTGSRYSSAVIGQTSPRACASFSARSIDDVLPFCHHPSGAAM